MEKRKGYGKPQSGGVRKRRQKTGRKVVMALVVTLLAVLVGLGGALGLQLKRQMAYFADHIVIGTVSVGGMTKEEAVVAVREKAEEQAAVQWTFFYGEDTFPLLAKQMVCLPEDVEAGVEAVWEQEQQISLWEWFLRLKKQRQGETTPLQFYPLPVTYQPEKKAEIAAQWHEKWDREPVNAQLSFSGGEMQILPAQMGLTVDEQTVFDGLPGDYAELKEQKIEIAMTEQAAEVTEKEWENLGLLSSYSTKYNPGEVNRTYNMSLAAGKVDGTILHPGEEFAFNRHVGERNAAAGYREGKIISGGEYVSELGGGICQVVSTIYNAVLLAGLQITERHNHGLEVAYVPAGRDATVYYGSQDFRFKNSNAHPIYIGTSLGGGVLTVNIYGNLDEKKKVEITTSLVQTLEAATEYRTNPELSEEKVVQGAKNGKVVQTYRNYLDEAGNLLNQESLGNSRYQPQNQIIERPDESAAEEEETADGETGESTETVDESQPTDMQPIDMEPVDMQPVDMEPIDMEPVDIQPIENEEYGLENPFAG